MCLGLDGVELPAFGVLDGAFGAGGGQRQAPGTATRSAVFLKLPPWRMRLGPTLGKPFTVEMLAKRDDREERATTK